MELETAIGYLVALAVPVWLLVEQGMSWRRSARRAGKQVEPGRLSGKPASSPVAKAPPVPAMRLANPRKTAKRAEDHAAAVDVSTHPSVDCRTPSS
jgi:hypothetical protein